MFNSFEIINGKMTPKYDEYNDTYSVTIEKDVTELDIKYELKNKNTNIVIDGNENIVNDTEVYIKLNNGESIRTITLKVIKTDTEATSNLKNYFTSLEVNKKEEMPEFIAPIIASSCFLIIIIVFSLLFHKRKKQK